MSRVLANLRDVLLLRISSERIAALTWRHLLFGLVLTALAGAGRWYDDPRISLIQQTGIGSVVYVFILAIPLWIVSKPLARNVQVNWTYLRVLTYVTLTAPPALLYALPIELWGTERLHLIYNTSALFVVSVWRVSMIVRFFMVGGEMTKVEAGVTTALVASGVITVMGFFGIMKSVATAMGGFRNDSEAFAAALAGYGFLGGIAIGIVSLIWYSSLAVIRNRITLFNPHALAGNVSPYIKWPITVRDSEDATFVYTCDDEEELETTVEFWNCPKSRLPGEPETTTLIDAAGNELGGRINNLKIESLFIRKPYREQADGS